MFNKANDNRTLQEGRLWEPNVVTFQNGNSIEHSTTIENPTGSVSRTLRQILSKRSLSNCSSVGSLRDLNDFNLAPNKHSGYKLRESYTSQQ